MEAYAKERLDFDKKLKELAQPEKKKPEPEPKVVRSMGMIEMSDLEDEHDSPIIDIEIENIPGKIPD